MLRGLLVIRQNTLAERSVHKAVKPCTEGIPALAVGQDGQALFDLPEGRRREV